MADGRVFSVTIERPAVAIFSSALRNKARPTPLRWRVGSTKRTWMLFPRVTMTPATYPSDSATKALPLTRSEAMWSDLQCSSRVVVTSCAVKS